MHDVAHARGRRVVAAGRGGRRAAGAANRTAVSAWLAGPAMGASGAMVDAVVARARAARDTEPGSWRCDRRASSWRRCRRRSCGRRELEAALGRAAVGQARRPDRVRAWRATRRERWSTCWATRSASGATCWSPAAAPARTSAPPPPSPPAPLGLECELLFPGAAPRPVPVNVALATGRRRAAARSSAAPRRDQIDEAVAGRAATLAAAGPSPVRRAARWRDTGGRLGYALAAQELARPVRPARHGQSAVVVVAAGSGGTLAGLVAGQVGFGLPWRTCRRVGEPAGSGPCRGRCWRWPAAARTCSGSVPPDAVHVDVRDLLGPGFGVPSGEDRVSADLALRREGLLLDALLRRQGHDAAAVACSPTGVHADRLLAHRRRRGRRWPH